MEFSSQSLPCPVGGLQDKCRPFGEEINLLHLPQSEPRIVLAVGVFLCSVLCQYFYNILPVVQIITLKYKYTNLTTNILCLI
jgi:hypothetical protein